MTDTNEIHSEQLFSIEINQTKEFAIEINQTTAPSIELAFAAVGLKGDKGDPGDPIDPSLDLPLLYEIYKL